MTRSVDAHVDRPKPSSRQETSGGRAPNSGDQSTEEVFGAQPVLGIGAGRYAASKSGHRQAGPVGAGLRSHSEGGAHDRRPRRGPRHRSAAHRRGRTVPLAGSNRRHVALLLRLFILVLTFRFRCRRLARHSTGWRISPTSST